MAEKTILSTDSQSKLFNSEDRHFWFKSRAEFIINRLKTFQLLNKEFNALEIGCGNGYTSSQLINSYSHYHALEGSQTAIENMQQRLLEANIKQEKYTLTVADLTEYKLAPESYQLVLAFDVLEHIDPQELNKTLKSIHDSLSINGKIVITVPAFKWLWTNIDTLSGHYQRFDSKSMTQVLEANGFKVDYLSYIFMTVLPFYLAQRFMLNQKQDQLKSNLAESHMSINPIINFILGNLTKINFIILSMLSFLPIGSSLFCIATKQEHNK